MSGVEPVGGEAGEAFVDGGCAGAGSVLGWVGSAGGALSARAAHPTSPRPSSSVPSVSASSSSSPIAAPDARSAGVARPHETDAEREAAVRDADRYGADLGSDEVAAGRGRALVLAYAPVREALAARANEPLRVVLIDGRSGSGKTTLADDLAGALDLRVVHMDDLYEGWEGLRAGSDYAWQRILEPLSRGETARWNRWDWHASARAEEHALAPGEAFVLEGCGSLSRRAAGVAGLAIWLELDEEERHRRAAQRDGDDSWWSGWRAQEDAFYAAERSSSLAGLAL